MRNSKSLIVIGGGAAGFFCAVNTARMNPDLRVMIVEKSDKVLSKVKISGGGRCNVTHACFELNQFIQYYPRGAQFLKKCFHWFNAKHTVEWFKERHVNLIAEPDGRMFSDTNTSQTIIDCLLGEAKRYEVNLLLKTNIIKILPVENYFKLTAVNGKEMVADYVCITTGGFPKLLQWNWLADLGHAIVPPVPSLFTFNLSSHPIHELTGISIPAVAIKINGTKWKQTGPLLITHFGFSGPAILKLSAWGARYLAEKNYVFDLLINWIPEMNEQVLRNTLNGFRMNASRQMIGSKCFFSFPLRLWLYFLEQIHLSPQKKWADISNQQINQLVLKLQQDKYTIQGKTTFKDEFVTAGGIDLSEVDANTLASKKIPHLFFAGEVLDIDGITGGFNFQNAWTTAFMAAKAIAADSSASA
ncbi:MAG: aminoacetone oxidase family FAD-binding enzyme [Sphingobacteriales bacterium]|uniref:NAD(P)/FAD-dependent oxidoreductase n=1 Tax=Hydrotalea flava TaxID=714549 RepID=UPI0008311D38|nr:NAD(P)/FAD-dependent oxidoreductase [Hydrotalea flava]RTL51050.1 MAG: aminoacetone oxidase family FAD-binding enzyme [Sphingobacteriales bacterium]